MQGGRETVKIHCRVCGKSEKRVLCPIYFLSYVKLRFVIWDQVCAFHGVSPRDRWLCVLPGWQMNVNVNVIWRHFTPVIHVTGL